MWESNRQSVLIADNLFGCQIEISYDEYNQKLSKLFREMDKLPPDQREHFFNEHYYSDGCVVWFILKGVKYFIISYQSSYAVEEKYYGRQYVFINFK